VPARKEVARCPWNEGNGASGGSHLLLNAGSFRFD
jgi:hypothetical protein